MSPLARITSVFAAFTLTVMLAIAPLVPQAVASAPSVSEHACSKSDRPALLADGIAAGALTGVIAA